MRASLLVAAGASLCAPLLQAKDVPTKDATARATLFQAEARRIFEKDQWKIVRHDQSGFTAIHPAAAGDATASGDKADDDSPLLVHVSIAFNPRDANSTDCVVKVEGFHLIRKRGERPHLAGPFKADYPENANYIRKVLETAEDRLGEKHPKYRAR